MSEMRTLYLQHGLDVEVYDQFYKGDDAIGSDIAFYIAQARVTGGPVLELGSGTGRVAWPLAEAGFDVTGLDMSDAMTQVAEAKRKSKPGPVQSRMKFVKGNMADFSLDETFSLVVIAFRTFQSLLKPEEQRGCLECVHRHLRPGGRLVIQIFDPRLDVLLPDAPRTREALSTRHPVTGNEVKIEVVDHVNDLVAQTFTERWRHTELDDDGKVLRREEEILKMSWIYRREMQYLFELTGYEVVAEFSDFNGAPPAYGREQIWVVQKA